MQGVEILDTTKVTVEQPFSEQAFWITFAVVALIGIALVVWLAILADESVFLLLIMAVIIVAALFGCLLGAGLANENEAVVETRYKVLVDDSVNMNEFFEKYELIDTEGKIFIVKEKE